MFFYRTDKYSFLIYRLTESNRDYIAVHTKQNTYWTNRQFSYNDTLINDQKWILTLGMFKILEIDKMLSICERNPEMLTNHSLWIKDYFEREAKKALTSYS